MFDHVHRREAKSEAIEEYDEQIRDVHEKYTQYIEDSMEAKVELVYGKKVQQRLLQTHDFEILPLWAEFEGLIVLLSRESNYGNADPLFSFRRIILTPCHPQHMFYQRRHSEVAVRQDKIMLAAARMAQRKDWIPGYYSEKKWYNCMAKSSVARALEEMKGSEMHDLTILQSDETTIDRLSPTGIWDDMLFADRPFSNAELRDMIPPALRALKDPERLKEWQSPADMPASVLAWFQGQKQVLFANVGISSFSDIAQTLTQILNKFSARPCTDLTRVSNIVESVLIHQQTSLDMVKGNNQEFWHSRFDLEAIEVICRKCRNPLKPDSKSRWSVVRFGCYLARMQRCKSDECKGNQRIAVPASKDLPYPITDARFISRDPKPEPVFDLKAYVRPDYDLDTHPSVVDAWCIRCKEHTITLKGGNKYRDDEARWTIGTPSLYIEREMPCKRCIDELRHGIGRGHKSRFVPVDETILSTTWVNLRNFDKLYSPLGMDSRRILLGKLQATSKQWRKLSR